MKVFISWSGQQSGYIAHTLRAWLPRVIQHLDPWMSKHDIDAGAPWLVELLRELEDTNFGIVCITAETLHVGSDWMLFEAGALAKKVERARVCPYLYGVEPSHIHNRSPLWQFQMKRAHKEETRQLLESLNKASEKALSPEVLNDAFEHYWPDLEAKLHAMPPSTTVAPPPRDERDMLEEILEMVRAQARRALSPFSELEMQLIGPIIESSRRVHAQRERATSMQDPEVTVKEPSPSSDMPQEEGPSSD